MEHKIETIADIINKVPIEKVDNFLADLKQFLQTRKYLSEMIGVFDIKCEAENYLTWIDDDKNNIDICLAIKEQ